MGAVGGAPVLLGLALRLLAEPGQHRHRHVVWQLPDEDAAVARHADQVAAVVGEAQARHQLRVAVHGGHAVARVVVVHGQRLVRARRRHVQAAVVQAQLSGTGKRESRTASVRMGPVSVGRSGGRP